MSKASNQESLHEFREPPSVDDLPEDFPASEGCELPDNWTVEGPNATKQQSRYYILTGKYDKQYTTIEKNIVVHQPNPESEWEVKDGRSFHDNDNHLGSGTLTEAATIAADNAKAFNEEYLSVDHITRPD